MASVGIFANSTFNIYNGNNVNMMQQELYRLATFKNWSPLCGVSPLMLSRCGFSYLGSSDAVECFECKTHLSGWSAFDNLQKMHRQKAPHCQLLNGNASTNIPLKMIELPVVRGSTAGRGEIEMDVTSLVLDRSKTVISDDPMIKILSSAHKRANLNGVFSSSTDCEIHRFLKPDYDRLLEEKVRFCTFYDWPSGAQANPAALAREGLFYTGTDDRVQCVFCRGSMRNWEPTDVPSAEHRKHFPGCPFVRGQDTGNVPIERAPIVAGAARTSAREQFLSVHNDPPQFPDHASISQRQNSFRQGHVSRGHTAIGLAEAGWFWTGPGDKVQCFHCGGNLRDWEPEDDPWEEHRRWYANCSYVKNNFPTGRRLTQEPAHQMLSHLPGPYRVEPREVKARMDTATVRAIQNMGYSKDLTRMVFKKRFSKKDKGSVKCTRLPEMNVRKVETSFTEQHNAINNQHIRKIRKQFLSVHNDPPQFPDHASISQRLNSFQQGQVSRGHTAAGLAEAGWFWTGPGDKVRCFHCGGNLRDWEPEDDPWVEHRRWYAKCSYVKDNYPRGRRFTQEPAHQMTGPVDEGCEVIQPVGKEEIHDSTLPTPESPGLSLTRFRISDTALTLITEIRALLDTLMTSNCCEVDESHGHPERLCAARDPVEDLGNTQHSPLPHPPTEPPPGTYIDGVVVENAVLCGEPGVQWNDEPNTPGEEEQGNICSVCLDNPLSCALCPCGHYACLSCINEWRRTLHRRTPRPATLRCHICRKEVEDVLPF